MHCNYSTVCLFPEHSSAEASSAESGTDTGALLGDRQTHCQRHAVRKDKSDGEGLRI